VQFLFCFIYPLPILAIHNEHEALGAGVVVSPERADFVLSSYIPNVKLDVLVRDGFYVETNYSGGVKKGELVGLCANANLSELS
jgi:hypothetical protein